MPDRAERQLPDAIVGKMPVWHCLLHHLLFHIVFHALCPISTILLQPGQARYREKRDDCLPVSGL
jgi:hypothetical protein